MAKVKTRHVILIIIGIILLTFALYTPAYTWLEDQFKPKLVVVYADTQTPVIDRVLFAARGEAYAFATTSTLRAAVPISYPGYLYILCYDEPSPGGSGINTVTATISAGTPTGIVTFTKTTDPLPDELSGKTDLSWWKATYSTPDANTNIDITPTVTDKAGNPAPTRTFYASTARPEGDFYINNQKVTTESVIYTNTLTLNIKFKATASGNAIKSVRYEIKDANNILISSAIMTETIEDTEWTGTYTLPTSGKYNIYGYFEDMWGAEFLRLSIGVDTGATPIYPATYYRLLIGLLGFIFIAYPIYDLYKKPKP